LPRRGESFRKEMEESEKMENKRLEDVCRYLAERAEKVARYSDKLREAMEQIEDFVNEVVKKSGVLYSVVLKEDKTGADGVWRYDILNAANNFALFSFKKVFPDGIEKTQRVFVWEQDRETLKLAVEQLPDFLAGYAEKLLKEGNDLADLAQRAEKIAAYAKKTLQE